MENILLSIIIPAHNAASTLERLIKSIPISNDNIEVIIIENGSKDNTFEIAQRLANRHRCIRALQSEKGVSAARNEGLKCAKGKWIAFADADDWFMPEALSEITEHTKADFTLFGYEAGKNNRCDDSSGQNYFRGKEC